MIKDFLNRNKRALFLILLFSFAFFVRFSCISKGPFHCDTVDLAVSAQKTLDTMRLHYEHGSGYPLTVIVGAFFIFVFRIFGVADPVFCVNFMSVFTGALGVFLLFILVEKFFDFHRASFSAILFACFAPHVAISTFGKSLTLGICMSLASAYFMYCYTQQHKKKDLIYSAVFLGFCAAARLSDVLVALPISYLFFSCGRINYNKIKLFIVFGFIAFLVPLIYYFPMFFDKGLSQFLQVLRNKNEAAYLGPFSGVFLYIMIQFVDLFGITGILFSFAGFLYMLKEREFRQFSFLMIWFLVLHLFYGGVSSTGLRYMVIAWIPLVVAQGSFLGRFKGAKFLLAFFAVLFIVLWDFARFSHILEFRHSRALQVEFSQWVAEQTQPDALIIAIDDSFFIKYYAKRKTLSRPITCDKAVVIRYFDEVLDKHLTQKRDVYCLSTALVVYDPCKVFRKELLKRYNVQLFGSRINEDWHNSLLQQNIIIEDIYKIEKKPQARGR